MSNVKLIKFKTGEEIISEIGEERIPGFIRLIQPAYAIVKESTVYLQPFLALAKNRKAIDVPIETVMCQVDPVNEVLNKYNSVFGSGIVVPN